MPQITTHNPDRFMDDLRQILSQGRKRIGLLIGAGAPVALKVNSQGELAAPEANPQDEFDTNFQPLIPDVKRLTKTVVDGLTDGDRAVVNKLLVELGKNPNIETILTRIRLLSQAIGSAKVYGLNGAGYEVMAERICQKIGCIVARPLPDRPNPYTELVSWVGGTHRKYPIEIFTPNYDLLLEEAFERARLPYFDGFTGSHKPFFDPASISDDHLPPRWSRLWKIHGSLGWEISGGKVVRTDSSKATALIYPDHLKYDQITRQPYSTLFERLRTFLMTPDSLLLCTGFSFSDAHITAILDETLASNTHAAIFAFQFQKLDQEGAAVKLAYRRPNFSVYARDQAMIFGVSGKWQPEKPLTKEWENIRSTFWSSNADGSGEFLLGDFAKLARFFALAQASTFGPTVEATEKTSASEQAAVPVAAAESPSENTDD